VTMPGRACSVNGRGWKSDMARSRGRCNRIDGYTQLSFLYSREPRATITMKGAVSHPLCQYHPGRGASDCAMVGPLVSVWEGSIYVLA
jgi:hypothetical protein